MTNHGTTGVANLDDRAEDSRQACFEQGKPCVYEPEDEPGIIVTEWPNGTLDRHEAESGIETRTWPDGSTETLAASKPLQVPHWPHEEAEELHPSTAGKAERFSAQTGIDRAF